MSLLAVCISSLEKYLFCSSAHFSITFLKELLFVPGCAGSLVLMRLSLAAAGGGCSRLQCPGFPLRGLLLLQSTDSRFQGPGVVARGLQSLLSMWNLPELGIRPASPAPVGGSTVPPGESRVVCIFDVESYELFPYVNNNSLSSYYLQIFSPRSVGCLFGLLMASFAVEKILSLLSYPSLTFYVETVLKQKICFFSFFSFFFNFDKIHITSD